METFLAGGPKFSFSLWTPHPGGLVARGPLRVSWVTCTVRVDREGKPTSSCAPSKPAPDTLDEATRAAVARCYEPVHERGRPEAVQFALKELQPEATGEPWRGALMVMITRTSTATQVPIYGPEGEFGPAPKCPAGRPGCDHGMVASLQPHNPPVGFKLKTEHTEQTSVLGDWPLPSRDPSPVTFELAIPASGARQAPVKDARFELIADPHDEPALANELATKLDAIDVAKEHLEVQEAYWLNRALVAMLRKDLGALEVAYQGLVRMSGATGPNSWARNAAHSIQKIRERGLLFEDPCR